MLRISGNKLLTTGYGRLSDICQTINLLSAVDSHCIVRCAHKLLCDIVNGSKLSATQPLKRILFDGMNLCVCVCHVENLMVRSRIKNGDVSIM